ncbi:protein-tyrosine phosphatase-like protein [Mycotypha africana]|uniref:protein-tyrosine phosphatase-like protein n=1 Tax=Mycotypha africana TaxID=64632 RepID=UPI002300501F|nr:protein-tyrosine phosphatase-like protein [Mycotypha africana]KAI8969054.1 protein-tyrosine phosphatase-like protein [Mycotypha africana]
MPQETTAEFFKRFMSDEMKFQDFVETGFMKLNDREKYRKSLKTCKMKAARNNSELNRYSDILPYDGCRVALRNPQLGESDDDYINASYIMAPFKIKKLYIATQGPLKRTIIDFWRMVVENGVAVIVCLTAEIENNKKKCERYWSLPEQPLEMENEKVKVKVYHAKKDQHNKEAECIIRTMNVEFYSQGDDAKLLAKRKVSQIQFLGWADHGIPKTTTSVINLVELARQLNPVRQQPPLVVHCSAGCGRTGTFCVLDIAETYLRQNPYSPTDPIYHITNEIRKARTTMVQTESQYEFCYRALIDFMSRKKDAEGTDGEKGNGVEQS